MDGLSAAASVVAILQITEVVVKYGVSVVNAKEERRKLAEELQDLGLMIDRLEHRCKGSKPDDSWYQGFNELVKSSGTLTPEGTYKLPKNGKPEGALAHIYQTIANLSTELSSSEPSHRLKKIGQRLTWYWDRDKFEEMLTSIKSARENINFILAQDQWDLTRAIQADGRDSNIKITDFINNRFTTFEQSFRRQQEKEQKLEEETETKAIGQWLSPLDFLARQEDLSEDRFPTGQWLLDHEAFKHWILGRPWHLRCYGEAGSGKTVLSSMVINYLQDKLETQTTPVICLYLDYKDSMRQTRENLFGSLLKQLIQLRQTGPIGTALQESYQKARRINKKQPGFEEVRRLLRTEIETYQRVFLVVDALDECSFRQKLVAWLRELDPEKMSILITSRRLDDEIDDMVVTCDYCNKTPIKVYFHCSVCNMDMCQACKERDSPCKSQFHETREPYDKIDIEIRTPDEEIERYVKWDMNKELGYGSNLWDDRIHSSRPDSSRFGRRITKNPELFKNIPSVVVEKAKGRILYARLYLDSLKAKQTLKGIQETLDGLPESFNDLYDEAMKRIKAQKDPESRATGLKTLSCIICAHRNLSLTELQHALALEPGDTEFDPRKDYDKEEILSSTCGLITITSDLSTVRPVHLTLQQYLNEPDAREKWFPEAEIDMATSCLTYLSFDALAKPSRSDEEFEAKQEEYPFLAYASQYWGDHVRVAGPDFDIEAAVQLISEPRRVDAYIQAAWYTDRLSAISWDVRRGVFDLHVCAWFGLSSVILALEQEGLEVDIEEGTYGQTPLMYACRRGQIEVVRELIGLGASVNTTSSRGRTPLFEAILESQEDIVDLILTREDLDINAVQTKEDNRTALMLAARLDQTNIVASLLRHPKMEVNQQDSHGWTALSIAIYKASFNVVEHLLQEPKLDVNLALTNGYSPLILAAMANNSAMVSLLLQKDAVPSTAILFAAEKSAVSVIQTMLNYSVGLDCLDDGGRGLFHHASKRGSLEVVRFLGQRDLNINGKDKNGLTPLHDSCCGDSEVPEVVEALLEFGADHTIKDNFGRSPLQVAWQFGYSKIVSILQTEYEISRSRPAPPLDDQKLPVWSLAKLGLSDLLSEALTMRPDPLSETEPGTNDSALHWAVIANQLQALQFLLQQDPFPDPRNCFLRTPLHLAAVKGNLLATKELLAHNASVDIGDRWHETAFYIAQRNKHYPVVFALIEAGAAITIPQIDVQRLFFAAVESGHTKAVEILLAKGADKLSHNSEGLTAWHLAKEADNGEMMQILRSAKTFSYRTKV